MEVLHTLYSNSVQTNLILALDRAFPLPLFAATSSFVLGTEGGVEGVATAPQNATKSYKLFFVCFVFLIKADFVHGIISV